MAVQSAPECLLEQLRILGFTHLLHIEKIGRSDYPILPLQRVGGGRKRLEWGLHVLAPKWPHVFPTVRQVSLLCLLTKDLIAMQYGAFITNTSCKHFTRKARLFFFVWGESSRVAVQSAPECLLEQLRILGFTHLLHIEKIGRSDYPILPHCL